MRNPPAEQMERLGADQEDQGHRTAAAASVRPAEAAQADETDAERDARRSINQRIFEISLDLILVVDRQGTFVRVSPSCVAILGYSPAEMIGCSARGFVCPEDLDATRREMRLARRGRLMRHFDCRYIHKDGHPVPLAWTGVWSEPDQQHFFIGRDMTERIAVDERLRHLQRLEAMGRLTGGIAHDFNNLLSVIIGNLDLLQLELADQPEAQELLESALAASLRGAEMTKQLLAFSRRQPLRPASIDLTDVVDRTARLLKRTLGEHIQVHSVSAPDLWLAEADPAQLESALMNLAINARDAMPSGGQLTIETANKHLDSYYVDENPDVVAGDYVMLAVSDTGAGMTAEIRDKVFEPFFSTKGNKGTGLGLSMVYGFTKQSRGHAKIYSELGHGTTVRLYLPRSISETSPSEPRSGTVDDTGLRGKTVLAVDDNPSVLETVLKQLTRLGYRVLQAENARAALQMLRSGVPVDLLFTDVVMPDGSGIKLADDARQLQPALAVLLTSGFTETAVRQPAESRRYPLLSKPYQLRELARKITEVLRDEQADA